jgi:hypothetical protein
MYAASSPYVPGEDLIQPLFAHTRRYKVPTLVVGGGGYTLRNVARCWCYETGRLMGHDLPDKLPDSVLNSFNYYMDNEKLRIEVGLLAVVCVDMGSTIRGCQWVSSKQWELGSQDVWRWGGGGGTSHCTALGWGLLRLQLIHAGHIVTPSHRGHGRTWQDPIEPSVGSPNGRCLSNIQSFT